SGEGSYDEVRKRLDLLTSDAYRHLFAGLLCTIDLANDPVTTYEALLEFAPPSVDFPLPHGNWGTPPPGWSAEDAPYGEPLIKVFDRWYDAPLPPRGGLPRQVRLLRRPLPPHQPRQEQVRRRLRGPPRLASRAVIRSVAGRCPGPGAAAPGRPGRRGAHGPASPRSAPWSR